MENILYLTYSNNQEGLVFPNELEEGIYAPGMWEIQAENIYKTNDSYLIDAIDNDELVKLNVSRVNGTLFQVDTIKYGSIFLRLKEIYERYNKYVGNSNWITENSRFFQLIPIEIPKLTELCLSKKFFLIGRMDDNLEKASLQQRI